MAVEGRQTARALMRAEFVGREPELEVLTACLAETLAGQPRVVICRGEAGIGKTRLANELLARARAHGALGVWGAADESVGLPPYWPWSQAFRAIAHTLDVPRIAKQDGLTAELARVAPDVFAGAAASEANAGSMDDRVRQFHAVAQMLRWACQQVPLVIILDDAHWADEPSLLLLGHIARGLTDERLLIIANARDLEHRSGEQLSRLLRHPTARLLELGGLSKADVRRQLINVLGRPVEDAELARACARTRGNPFLVQEAGRALASADSGGDVPPVTPTLRAAIAGRLERLSPRTMRLMESASVLGQEFSAALLMTMQDVPALECLAALDEAQRAALVEPGSSSDEFRFVHALVRDAIEAALSRPYLVHLHRLAAEAITRVYVNPTGAQLFDLAHHSAEGALEGDPVAAAGWSEGAAEQALRQLGYEEASRLFAQALRVGGAALEDEHRVRLLLAEASALNLAGDLGGRLRNALEAAENARRLQRPDLIAQAALVMEATGLPGFDVVTRRLCQEALTGLGDDNATLRARTTARFAETFIYLADTEAAEQASRYALELAEVSQDPLALAAALRARQVVCAGPEGLEVRAHLAERLLALSQRTADPKMELSARCWRIDVWFEQGDLGRIAAELDALHACAQELGGPVARFTLLHSRAALAQAQARFADARRLISAAFAALAATDYAQRFYVRAAVLGFVGHHAGQDDDTLTAAAVSDAPPETIGTPPLIGPLAHALALAEAGRLEDAANLYRSLGPVAAWRPAPHVVLLVYGLGIAIARLLNQTSDVAALRKALLPYRGHHVVSGIGAMSYFGPVELWLGVAAASLGLLDDAIADLQEARDICSANGALGFEIESMAQLAEALVRRARPEDVQRARQLLADAAPRASQLGMRPVAASIQRLSKQLVGADSLQLSGRELEVAQLVADGLTNRQISHRLIISERTAQNHVQHILTKLGLANRSQIARMFATRKMSKAAE